ncbi:hypothetical protein [Stappia sp. ES.058]|uniref:hypothetical protein n=1 Tax=Stappia sp. ES.058 TaxID=1881061 RepID=UPI000B8A2517|nr:hypothetical protein [Stappia sp. ES.058]
MQNLFRRKQPERLCELDALSTDLARRAIVLARRSIVEYTRMRVGRNWPQLFSEAAFQEALTCACKAATPLCLVWTTRTARRAGLTAAACCEVCVDPAGPHDIWCETLARAAVVSLGRLPASRMDEDREDHAEALRALRTMPSTPPASLSDVVAPREAARFALLLPLDRSFTDDDRETIRNTLRLALAETYEDLSRHLDVAALTRAGHAT